MISAPEAALRQHLHALRSGRSMRLAEADPAVGGAFLDGVKKQKNQEEMRVDLLIFNDSWP